MDQNDLSAAVLRYVDRLVGVVGNRAAVEAVLANPLAVEVFNDIDRLVLNLDAVQAHLDRARADMADTNSLFAVEMRRLCVLRQYGAEVLTIIAMPAEQQQAERSALAEAEARAEAAVIQLAGRCQQLAEVVALLVFARGMASVWSRARLIPGVLLTAAAVAVVVYALSGGGVVPGFSSFVRVSALLMCFLLGGNLMRL